MTMVLLWNLSRDAIYWAASEQSLLEVDVLVALKIDKFKDLSSVMLAKFCRALPS